MLTIFVGSSCIVFVCVVMCGGGGGCLYWVVVLQAWGVWLCICVLCLLDCFLYVRCIRWCSLLGGLVDLFGFGFSVI